MHVYHFRFGIVKQKNRMSSDINTITSLTLAVYRHGTYFFALLFVQMRSNWWCVAVAASVLNNNYYSF
jgi:hypothetical protein